MNKKDFQMMDMLDGISDELLADALPPNLRGFEKSSKSYKWIGFFEKPWVVAVISASVALAVLSGIIWAGQRAAKDPLYPSEGIAGLLSDTLENVASATDKKPDYDNPPVPEDAQLVVSSGGFTIAPIENVQWTQYWNEDQEKMVVTYGKNLWGDHEEDEVETQPEGLLEHQWPTIPYADDLSMKVENQSLELQYAEVFFSDLTFAGSCSFDHETIRDLLAGLLDGTYYVMVTAFKQGNYIKDEGYEGTMYQFVFCVDVLGDGSSPYAPLNPVDVEVYAGSGDDRVLLPPYLTVHTRYDEETGEEYSGRGYDAATVLAHVSGTLPTFTYTDGFTMTIKDVEGYGQYNGITVYDEAFNVVLDSDNRRWEELPTLSPGCYYVVLHTLQRGQEYLEKMDQLLTCHREKGWYWYGFRLNVSENSQAALTVTYDMIELEPIEPIDAKVMIACNGDYTFLRPYSCGSKRYWDDLGQWVNDIDSDGLDLWIWKEYSRLPVVTWGEDLGVHYELLEELEPDLVSMKVYDEHFNVVIKPDRYADESLAPVDKLKPGTYYVVLRIAQTGRKMGYVEYENGDYEYGFTLVVPET